jgi:ubiquinone/menaquinone biosynthesis C-methylase UbiE
MNNASVRNDFDEIARLSDGQSSGTDRYDSFLVSLVPTGAAKILEVGCGSGRLTVRLAASNCKVTAIDLSPEMIARARRRAGASDRFDFLCGDFLDQEFTSSQFDCVVSAAALHHMPQEIAISRMAKFLRPGGRLVLQDMRSDYTLSDHIRSCVAIVPHITTQLLQTGRLRSPRLLRNAWARHCANEKYFSIEEAEALAARHLPRAVVINHWLWRYTIVWDKPQVS